MSNDKVTNRKLQRLPRKILWFSPKRWQPRDITFGECRLNFFFTGKIPEEFLRHLVFYISGTCTHLYNLVECDPCLWIHITHGGKNTLQITADRRGLKYSPVQSLLIIDNRCYMYKPNISYYQCSILIKQECVYLMTKLCLNLIYTPPSPQPF